MSLLIKHRVNRIVELSELEKNWGVEIDLRSNVQRSGTLHISHDPWAIGDDFEDWLSEFKAKEIRGPLILNTKEDGLEAQIFDVLKKFDVKNYFFLDTSFPTLIRWTQKIMERRFALRISVYESPASIESFRGKAEWVWVDCFDGVPMPVEVILPLKKDFKICLVSPELQGKPIDEFKNFEALGALADAICTKNPVRWKSLLAR